MLMPTIGHMLTDTITVTRPSNSVSAGTHSDSYAAHLSGISCRIHRMSGQEAIEYGAERNDRLWRISVEATTTNDIRRRDRITYTDNLSVSHTLDVIEDWDSGEQGIIRVLIAREVS